MGKKEEDEFKLLLAIRDVMLKRYPYSATGHCSKCRGGHKGIREVWTWHSMGLFFHLACLPPEAEIKRAALLLLKD